MNKIGRIKPKFKILIIICIIFLTCILYKAGDFYLNFHFKTELGDTVILHQKFNWDGTENWVTLNGKEMYNFRWPDGVMKTQENFVIYFYAMVKPIYSDKKVVLYRIWDRFTDPLGKPKPCDIVYAYSTNGQQFYNYHKDFENGDIYADRRLNFLFRSVSQKEIESIIAKQQEEDLIFFDNVKLYHRGRAPNPWTGEPIRY